MITTERLTQIEILMGVNLPLATHGSNAFDPITRITVGDVWGLIDAAKVALAPPAPLTVTTAPPATATSVVGMLVDLSPADRHNAAEGVGETVPDAKAGEAEHADAGTHNPPEQTAEGTGAAAQGAAPVANQGASPAV